MPKFGMPERERKRWETERKNREERKRPPTRAVPGEHKERVKRAGYRVLDGFRRLREMGVNVPDYAVDELEFQLNQETPRVLEYPLRTTLGKSGAGYVEGTYSKVGGVDTLTFPDLDAMDRRPGGKASTDVTIMHEWCHDVLERVPAFANLPRDVKEDYTDWFAIRIAEMHGLDTGVYKNRSAYNSGWVDSAMRDYIAQQGKYNKLIESDLKRFGKGFLKHKQAVYEHGLSVLTGMYAYEMKRSDVLNKDVVVQQLKRMRRDYTVPSSPFRSMDAEMLVSDVLRDKLGFETRDFSKLSGDLRFIHDANKAVLSGAPKPVLEAAAERVLFSSDAFNRFSKRDFERALNSLENRGFAGHADLFRRIIERRGVPRDAGEAPRLDEGTRRIVQKYLHKPKRADPVLEAISPVVKKFIRP